jgi:sugar phosphate isomerase/epimerase
MELRASAVRVAFRESLAANGLNLFTLNGFPYGDFHAAVVKQQVYQPDWADPRRLQYTHDLARLLAECLPAGQGEGTISTLPLGFKPDWTEARQQQALTALCRLVVSLAELRERGGRNIRVCLEPEPGCVIESTDEALRLFVDELPLQARRLGIPAELLDHHLGVCFDVCHQAVMFEDPAVALTRLQQAGIAIGKIQLSSALAVTRPDGVTARAALAEFAEPKYLHQARTRMADGGLRGVMDLPAALAGELPTEAPWRIHFHLPIQAATLTRGELSTTQTVLEQTFDWLAAHPMVKPHLEVETYTWQVLPPELRPKTVVELQQGLAGELTWAESQLDQRGLLELA